MATILIGKWDSRLRTLARATLRVGLAGAVVLLADFASAQNSQFLFDANGNLLVQRTELSAPPQLLGQPQTQVIGPGEPASFSVVAADTRGLTYQWLFNGTTLPGATADALLFPSASTANEGLYSVVLANSSGSVTSSPAALLLDADGDGLPDSWEQTYFGSLSQNALGDADGDGVSNLKELLDGTNPTNNASARFRLTVSADGGILSVTPNQLSYTNGQVVMVAITDSLGDVFQGWTGDAIGTNNPLTLIMTNNRTVFAHFRTYEIVWTNLAGGNWHEPLNWSPNLVPDADDTVWITNVVTVTVSGDAHCGNLGFGSGQAPTLTGAGALTIHGTAVWAQGTMAGAGRTIVAPGATLTLTYGLGLSLNTRTLENGGTIILSGAGGLVIDGSVLTNRPGSLFLAQNSAPLSFGGGVTRFDNAGTFRRTGSGATSAAIPFNNYGIVEIPLGTLSLFGGGTHSGSFDVASGSTLNFAGGTHIANASSSITGTGNLTVSGSGTTTLAGLVNLSGTHTLGGLTVNLTGNYICTNTVIISGGVANFNGAGTVTPTVLTLNGTLSGSNVVTVLNQMTWSGGGMSGGGRTIIPAGATLTINSLGSVNLNTRTLDNGGTVLWTGAGGITMTSAVITNRPGALFQAQSAAAVGFGGGVCRFDNAGTFRKSAGGTTTFFGTVSFNNYAAVELLGGSLDLGGGGTHTGSFDVSAGRTLILSGGTHTATPNSTITGAGNLTVSGSGTTTFEGLVNLSGTHTIGGLIVNITGNYICTNNTLAIPSGVANFNGIGTVTPSVLTLNGTLSGSNLVTVLNQMTWSGGGMSGNGRTIIPAGATLTINSLGSVVLNTRTLDNGGTVLWTGAGGVTLNGAVITNRPGALFQVQNAASFGNGGSAPRFDNAGTLRKTSSGTTTFSSGVRLNNYGTVEIRRGILQASGGYTSSGGALLNSALGGTVVGTGFGQLQVAGTVNLDGSLSVDLVNGFIPAVNDSFAVLAAGTRNGTFANFYYPSNEVTMQLSNAPTSVIVRVADVLVVPRPLLLQPELSGTDLRLTWTALSNTSYRLEFSPDLRSSNWTALPGDLTALSNTASRLDPLTPSNRVYRVRVLP